MCEMIVGPQDRGLAIRVEGRVQGVGFRWWVQALGREIGVRGWVRNLSDGSVEVHVAGDETLIEEFEDRLQAGPDEARVERVLEMGCAEVLPRVGFEIRR